MDELQPLDLKLRRSIYDRLLGGGTVPKIAELSSAAKTGPELTRASLERLAAAHMLVLQADGEILMANPFSAVPTPFPVHCRDASWYANCIWDAMGIAAMLRSPVQVLASCGCCGTSMPIRVPDDCSDEAEWRAHFAIPAAHWWDDIVFN